MICLRTFHREKGKLDICLLTPVLHWLKPVPGRGHPPASLPALPYCSAPEGEVLIMLTPERRAATQHLSWELSACKGDAHHR